MLAIKTLLSRFKKLPTIMFDEIDTGVSGKISDNIAEIMAIGIFNAGIYDNSFTQKLQKAIIILKLKKRLKEISLCRLNYLNPKQRIDEIAMMLSGNKITDTVARAKQLMNQMNVFNYKN